MFPLSDNPVKVAHLGNGIVGLQVPVLDVDSNVKFSYKPRLFRSVRHAAWKANAPFFRELLREGFLNNGAIAFDGYLMPLSVKNGNQPVFRTVIQLDGDITCKIDEHVFEKENADDLIRGYIVSRETFLDDFEKGIRFSLGRILALISSVPGLYLLYRLLELIS